MNVTMTIVLLATAVCYEGAVFAQEINFARDIQPLLARRCFACHGPAEHEGGVAFHVRESALAESENSRVPIVPGDPDASELIRRITATDHDERMPPEGPPLSPSEVAKLRAWIRGGAVYEQHWAFVPPTHSELPKIAHTQRVRNEIDTFVFARLEREKLAPSAEARREKLLRRLYVDLTGLLPPADELDDLLGDGSNDAYERVVDRLLASQHFGERWGRHWLDLARYADTFGYERDDVRPNAWRYRDWVIHSFNRNQPFDQFVIEQLAGDLLDEPTRDQQIATGMHRMNIKNNESGINKEDYRNRETVDRVNTTSTALLGLTVGCAQCHPHKYDPISQDEYYQLYAFFNNVREDDIDIEGSLEEQARYKAALADYENHKKQLESQKSLLESMRKHKTPQAWIKSFVEASTSEKATSEKATSEKATSEKPAAPEAKEPAESEPSTKSQPGPDDVLKRLSIGDELRAAICKSDVRAPSRAVLEFWSSLDARQDDTVKAIRQLSVQNRHLPKPYVMTLAELKENRRETHVLLRGDFKQKGVQVSTRPPAVLNPFTHRGAAPDRLDLAKWIVNRQNPLTARVAVNHIWQHLFGRGLVSTPDDFGTQGEPPSHPRLLDWLAVELMESGWDRKRLIKTIVMSSTYRQDSALPRHLSTVDPRNQLLGRQARFRVEAEVVRDLFLDAGGLLHRELGGPTIHPKLPAGVSDLGYKYKTRWTTSDKPDRYRRGLYVHFKRTNPYPSLIMFDASESNVCLAKRNRSNTPLQALTTLNDPVFVECAQALGRTLCAMSGDDSLRLRHAGRTCLGRNFTARESDELARLVAAERAWFSIRPADAAALVGDHVVEGEGNGETAAWITIARTILNLDEFITRE